MASPKVSPEMRLKLLHDSAVAFCDSDIFSSQAQGFMVKALAGLDFKMFEASRLAWQSDYLSAAAERGNTLTEEAAAKAWSRLTTAAGIEKPRSLSAEAVKKAAAREKARKALAKVAPEALEEKRRSLADAVLQGDKAARVEYDAIGKELTRREEAAAKDAGQITKQLRDEVIALVKKANHETLETIRAILKGEVEVTHVEPAAEALKIAA